MLSLCVLLTEGIDAVFAGNPAPDERAARFSRFVEFSEALVAYHRTQEEQNKAQGGRGR